jgi:hypothetical protein
MLTRTGAQEMNRSIRLIAIVTLATSITACSQAAGSVGDAATPIETATLATAVPSASPMPNPVLTPPASPMPSPVATPSPTQPATDPATVLAAHGIGPYVVGARLAVLESKGLVTNVEPSFNCDDEWQSARATSRYAGQLSLSFYLGRLTDVYTDSPELVTPSDASVGMPLTELQRIYGERGTLITGVSANQAFSVHVPDGLGIVFFLDETNTIAQSMSAGEVERLDIMAVVGEGC